MWHYNRLLIRRIEDLPDHTSLFGFCYKITNLKTGGIYIGKKQFWSTTKKKLTRSEQSPDQRKKKYKRVCKESNWKDYCGSNPQLKDDLAKWGPHFFTKEILAVAHSKKHLSYLEAHYQFHFDVLRQKSYNKNILGKFFAQDLEQPVQSTSKGATHPAILKHHND